LGHIGRGEDVATATAAAAVVVTDSVLVQVTACESDRLSSAAAVADADCCGSDGW